MEPPGAWGQRGSIWLKVQLRQPRLLNCESRRKRALCPCRSRCQSRKQSRLRRSGPASLQERGRDSWVWWPPVPCPRTFPNEPRQLTLAQARSITSSPRLPVRVRSDHRDTWGACSRQRKVGWTHRFRRAVRAPGENPKTRTRSLRNASLPLPLWGERGSGSPPRTAFCQGLSPSRAASNGNVPVPLGSPIGDAPAAFS